MQQKPQRLTLFFIAAAFLAALFLLPAGQSAYAADEQVTEELDADLVKEGHELAKKFCSRCHAVGASGDSPFAEAPLFGKLANTWNPEVLAEAFAEGIVVGHQAMPEFMLEPDQIGALIEYLKSLRNS